MAQNNHNDGNNERAKQYEWLFISTTVSVAGGAVMGSIRGVGWGIVTFLLAMAFCWISYMRKKK